MKLYVNGTLSNFVYTWFVQHKDELSKYKQSTELMSSFKAGETEWNALKNFASRDSIQLSTVSARDKANILKRMPSLLARQIWRNEGYYEVLNKTDDFVQKALQVVEDNSSAMKNQN